jgi:glycosyltransferase involved in cell wall biosynthesis
MAPTDAKSEGQKPFVSIGLPVYNGEDYLEEALDSIAAQTYRNYEVVISDNASTDRSPEICERYAARDPRIRIVRNSSNIGGDRNYYRCFELSRGQYFLGTAHDDRFDPRYLERVIAVLEADPEVVFCHSRTHQIDGTGSMVGTYDARPFTESSSPSERFRDAIGLRPVIACLGVIRASVLRQMPALLAYPASDAFWQAELALRGKLVEIPEILFYRRVHPNSGQRIPLYERIRWSDPSKAGAVVFPSWRRTAEYARAVMRAPLTLRERMLCFAEIGRYLRRRGGLKTLLRDVRMALRTLLLRTRSGHWLVTHRHRAQRH